MPSAVAAGFFAIQFMQRIVVIRSLWPFALYVAVFGALALGIKIFSFYFFKKHRSISAV
jgi:undecaprenyl pyrophosphate phosphatase UppP